jgi:C-terminal region of aryl-sulfatase
MQAYAGQVGAVRIGNFKAVYHTGGIAGCGQAASPFQARSQPLVFDLSADPEERFPLSGAVKGFFIICLWLNLL